MNRFTKAVHAFSVGNIAYVLLSNAIKPMLEKYNDFLVDILLGITTWLICVCLTYAVLWVDEKL